MHEQQQNFWDNRYPELFLTIHCQANRTTPGGGRKGMQDGSHASQAWLKAAPGSCPITRKLNGQNGTQAGHTIKNQRLPCARLYRDRSPPQHPRRSCWTQQTVPWTRTGWGGGAAECVYIIDDGCSNVVKVYGQRLPEVKLGQVENPGSWYSDP